MRKNYFLLVSLALLIVLNVINVSAQVITYAEWENQEQVLTIRNGQESSFNFLVQTFTPPMDVQIELLDSQGNIIYTFADITFQDNTLADTLQLTQADYNQDGEYSLVVSAQDSSGDTDFHVIHAIITPNSPPTLEPIGNQQIDEEELLEFQLTVSDEDNDPLTINHSPLPGGAIFDQNTLTFSWKPTYEYIQHPATAADAGITFTITDGFVSTEESVIISVNDVNRLPVIQRIPNITISENTQDATLDLNKFIADDDNDIVTWTTTSGENINVDINQDNIVTFTPNQDFTGQEEIPFTAEDGFGGIVSTMVTVIVTKNPEPPTADVNGPYSGTPGDPVTLDASASTDNDGEIVSYMWDFGDGITETTNTPTTAHVYTTEGQFTLTLTVTDNDGLQDTDSTIVSITPTPINNPPEIISTPIRNAITNQQYLYDVEAIDIDQDILTYSLTTSPIGMFIDSTTGLITWTPTRFQEGKHNVAIQVKDAINTAKQFFTITVKPKNEKRVKKHKFSLNNIQIREKERFIDIYANLRNLGNQEEEIKLTTTINGKQTRNNLQLDIHDSRWILIKIKRPASGRYVLEVKAVSDDDRDTIYRVINID